MGFDAEQYMVAENTSLRAFQLKNLEILVYFDKFCRENNIIYYICGGTCIGAVRHKGFIPWDCDIDVFLYRKDYNRLPELWKKKADTEHYTCDITTRDYNQRAQVICIKDNNTTYIRSFNTNEDINHGITMDVLPLDGLSKNWIFHQLQKIDGLLFCLFNADRLPNQEGGFVRKLAHLILSIVRSKRIKYIIWSTAEKRLSRFDADESSYIGELTAGVETMKIAYPKEWFAKPQEILFEGIKVYAPTEIDKYLKLRYGDYMKFPVEEEQIPKMSPAYIDINKSYKNYRGSKYYKGS